MNWPCYWYNFNKIISCDGPHAWPVSNSGTQRIIPVSYTIWLNFQGYCISHKMMNMIIIRDKYIL